MQNPVHIPSRYINSTLIVFYAVGTVGLLLNQTQELFLSLVPAFLCLVLLLLFLNHKEFKLKGIIWYLLTIILGFSAEWLGVHTGVLFGNYSYGANLGWKLDDIPLVIGVNWLILAYISWDLAQRIFATHYLRVPVAAFFMVVLDFAIEPTAIKLDFWQWSNGTIPISNYLGWFGVSCLIFIIARLLKVEYQNRSSSYVYLSMFLFFILLNSIG